MRESGLLQLQSYLVIHSTSLAGFVPSCSPASCFSSDHPAIVTIGQHESETADSRLQECIRPEIFTRRCANVSSTLMLDHCNSGFEDRVLNKPSRKSRAWSGPICFNCIYAVFSHYTDASNLPESGQMLFESGCLRYRQVSAHHDLALRARVAAQPTSVSRDPLLVSVTVAHAGWISELSVRRPYVHSIGSSSRC